MHKQRIVPDRPLTFIQHCVRQRKIFWTYHINMRLRNRGISRSAIVESVETYEVIEEYPDDKYFPSYLVCGRYQGNVVHIVFAADVNGENVRMITAYYPNPLEWEQDLKTRRRSS